jgi:hypothetical protein
VLPPLDVADVVVCRIGGPSIMEGTASLVLPRRSRGYQSEAAAARYQVDLEAFCEAILEIN